MAKAKIPTRIIESDSCVVTIDDVEYPVHVGETVEIIPITEVRETAAFTKLGALQVELEAARGDEDEVAKINEIMNRHFDIICESVASKIVAWDWTDMRGQPLPQPNGDPEVFKRLTTEELYWLLRAVQRREAPVDRKNDSRPGPTTSSDTAPQTAPTKSGSGRSRSKAA